MPSDQITVAPPIPPFPRLERINPSPDVQQQVASAIEACTKWQPQVVQVGKDGAPPAELTTEAQVCEVLDRWPLMHGGQQLQVASVGVGLAIIAALVCMVAWVVLRGLLNLLPLALLTDRCVSRAVGGALCGVGLVTFYLLLSLHDFTAATPEEFFNKLVLFLVERGATGGGGALPAVRAIHRSRILAPPDIAGCERLRVPAMFDMAACRTA